MMMNVKRIVHNDIEREFSDEVTRRLALHTIACYEKVYGERTDKEFAACLETPGRDVWCFARRLSPLEWEVYIEPEEAVQEYLKGWDDCDFDCDCDGPLLVLCGPRNDS